MVKPDEPSSRYEDISSYGCGYVVPIGAVSVCAQVGRRPRLPASYEGAA